MKKGDEENRKRALKLLVITDSQVLLSVLEAVRYELEDRTQAIRNGDPVPRIVVVAGPGAAYRGGCGRVCRVDGKPWREGRAAACQNACVRKDCWGSFCLCHAEAG